MLHLFRDLNFHSCHQVIKIRYVNLTASLHKVNFEQLEGRKFSDEYDVSLAVSLEHP